MNMLFTVMMYNLPPKVANLLLYEYSIKTSICTRLVRSMES